MRKSILVLALLFCCGVFLSAQSRPDASIYVTPVTGKGSKPEDNLLFYTRLVNELTIQKAKLANASKDAEYSLFGTLAPYKNNEGQYVFHLELRDNKTVGITVEGELVYEVPDDTNQLFPILVNSLLYTIPPETIQEKTVPAETVPVETNPVETIKPETPSTETVSENKENKDEWRDKMLYFGLAVTWTPRIYRANEDSGYLGDPHFGFSFEYHFLSFMSLETGLELAVDEVKVRRATNVFDIYHDTMIEIPILVKYVAKPNAFFMLEPYIGGQFNIPLLKTTIPPPFSFLAGLQYGVKVGPGALFLDARFVMDIADSKVNAPAGVTAPAYRRYIIHLGLGYKYGILQRK